MFCRTMATSGGGGKDDEDFNYDKSFKMQSSVGNFLKEMQQRASNIPEKYESFVLFQTIDLMILFVSGLMVQI